MAAGAADGLLFGPAGLAAGMVAGGMAWGVAEGHSGPRLRSALFDEVRDEVPEGSSALVMFAASGHVDAMVQALAGHGGRLVRHVLSPQAADAFEAAVADSPSAAPSQSPSVTRRSTRSPTGVIDRRWKWSRRIVLELLLPSRFGLGPKWTMHAADLLPLEAIVAAEGGLIARRSTVGRALWLLLLAVLVAEAAGNRPTGYRPIEGGPETNSGRRSSPHRV